MKEKWRPIPGYSNYEVSDKGQVYSIPRIDSRGAFVGGKFLKSKTRQITIIQNGRILVASPARLMLMAFARLPKKGEVARHLDDNPLNTNLENCMWGTRMDNKLDAVRNGLRGPNSPCSVKISILNRDRWKNGLYDHLDHSTMGKISQERRRIQKELLG